MLKVKKCLFKGYTTSNYVLEELKKECPGCIPGVFDWFKEHLCEVIISGILRPLHEDADLDVPLSAFSTNANESVNATLKRNVDYKKNKLPVFI